MIKEYFTRFGAILPILVILAGFNSVAMAQDVARPEPEIATGTEKKSKAVADRFMAVTANPHATRAAYDMLLKGGNAVDAAVAAQLVLGLVEPHASGLGGGAFVLYYDADNKRLIALDGRETAPSLAGPFLFAEGGTPMAFEDAVPGGRSVGVPGTPKLLYDMHQAYGKLTWMELFDPAIKLAEEGFEISLRLAAMITAHKETLKISDITAAYFLTPEGEPKPAGTDLTNPAYAETLKDFAFSGPPMFYRGQVAGNIVETVQNFESNPGLLSAYDFESYEVKKRPPVCGPYRLYIICSMGEPSSGALTMLQILGMIEAYDLPAWGADDARSWHVIAEASRLAFADRNHYMADPDFVNTPGVALLEPAYIDTRRALISKENVMETVKPGDPPGWEGPLYEKGLDADFPGTSQISVVDADGNIVSMTTTIESAFGSHLMVDGFLLNNELTDFSFVPFGKNGELVANMAEGGKRPRSSMSPTIVFDRDGHPVLVIGSAGGSRIIGFVLQRIIAVLDWGMDIQEALDMPNMLSRGGAFEAEKDLPFLKTLEKMGHEVKIDEMNSGMTAIHFKGGKLYGAADPRREGIGMGE